MQMKSFEYAAALALALGVGAATAAGQVVSAPAQQTPADTSITITGCVVKGDNGYVLTNVAEQTAAAAVAGSAGSTAERPAGTVGPAQVIYWLDGDDDLKDHAGQKVEVRGTLEGEIGKGEVAAEIENGLVELEFKVDDARRITVTLPQAPVGTSGTITDKEVTRHFVVRKIDVDSVKTIASACR
jgi:hypothetical protein